jgi:hypothetical protein
VSRGRGDTVTEVYVGSGSTELIIKVAIVVAGIHVLVGIISPYYFQLLTEREAMILRSMSGVLIDFLRGLLRGVLGL